MLNRPMTWKDESPVGRNQLAEMAAKRLQQRLQRPNPAKVTNKALLQLVSQQGFMSGAEGS